MSRRAVLSTDLSAADVTYPVGYEDRLAAFRWVSLGDHATRGCPRYLVRKRHVPWNRQPRCWCHSQLCDHAGHYRHADSGRLFTAWEPYGANGSELQAVIAAARADGIRVHVDGRSPYWPGSTVAILFYAGDDRGLG